MYIERRVAIAIAIAIASDHYKFGFARQPDSQPDSLALLGLPLPDAFTIQGYRVRDIEYGVVIPIYYILYPILRGC